jgi:hypothetical protein
MIYSCDFLCIGTCPWNDFACLNGKCIPHLFKCDGYNNCGDGSDESSDNCPNGKRRIFTELFIGLNN